MNEKTEPTRPNDLRCNRIRPFRPLKKLAAQDRADELRHALEGTPDLLDDTLEMAEVLHEAAIRGKSETVSVLMDAGVDPNVPAPFKEGCDIQSLLVTALCAAFLKGHGETTELLKSRGAIYDIFTASLLGDAATVSEWLKQDPDLVRVEDPVSDVLEVMPIHHAVYGGHLDVVRFLFDEGAGVGKNSTALVRQAANRGQSELTRLLLDHGADATRVGPGAWVLEPEIVDLLMPKGADVNYPDGAWIWRSCTGNNSQRDNPAFVGALLDRGAKIDTRLRGATALHYTAKAGFLESTQVLLDRGADPNAVSDEGETPLFYAFKAGKRADMVSMVGLLVSNGANVNHPNLRGKTPTDTAKRMRRPDKTAIVSALKAAG